MKLIQRVHPNESASSIVHSSVYAKAQQTHGGVEQHSSMAYSERKKIEKNRTLVRGYDSSMITKSGNKRRQLTVPESQAMVDDSAMQQQLQRAYGQVSMKEYIEGAWGYKQRNNTGEAVSNRFAARTADNNTERTSSYNRTMPTPDNGAASNGYASAIQARQTRAERFNVPSRRPSSSSISAPRQSFHRH